MILKFTYGYFLIVFIFTSMLISYIQIVIELENGLDSVIFTGITLKETLLVLPNWLQLGNQF